MATFKRIIGELLVKEEKEEEDKEEEEEEEKEIDFESLNL